MAGGMAQVVEYLLSLPPKKKKKKEEEVEEQNVVVLIHNIVQPTPWCSSRIFLLLQKKNSILTMHSLHKTPSAIPYNQYFASHLYGFACFWYFT
jgi:hypothetical protein